MFTEAGKPTLLRCDAVSHCFPQSNWALPVLIPRWMGLCTFWDPVGLSNELSCEAGSFFHCHLNPHRGFSFFFFNFYCYSITGVFSIRCLRFIFPGWNPGLCRLSHSLVVPPSLSACKCVTTQSAIHRLTESASYRLAHQPQPCLPRSSSCHIAMSPLCLAACFHPFYWSG